MDINANINVSINMSVDTYKQLQNDINNVFTAYLSKGNMEDIETLMEFKNTLTIAVEDVRRV